MNPHNETDIPAPIRTALQFLRLADLIRCPNPSADIGGTNGRELLPKEQETEDAALLLLRDYFALTRRNMMGVGR